MSKIKNLFKGSSLAIVIAGLIVAGVASAALVNYLSNAPTATVAVVSPVEMSICEGETATGCVGTSVDISTTGLSDVKFTTVAKNNANNAVSGYRVLVVRAPWGENLTGKEFTEVMFRDALNEPFDMIDMLYVVRGDGTLTKLSEIAAGSPVWGNRKMILLFVHPSAVFTDPETYKYELAVGESNWNKLQVTLGNIIGTYGVSTQYVYDLVSYAAEQYSQ